MRRRLLSPVLWLAVLAPAWGAEIAVVRAVPVQLTLPFAAVAPMTAASALPVPAAAPEALAPLSAAAPPEVLRAVRGGDAQAYLAAVRKTGYEPPEGDDAQAALLNEGLEREAAERAFFAAVEAPSPVRAARRATKIDYAEFGRRLARTPVSLDLFRDAGAKRAILRAAGYDAVTGPGGRRIRLEDASDARVGRVFLSVKRSFEKR